MKSLKDKVVDIEKEAIINALKECNWVMAKAARELGITERMIGYKMKKYGIRKWRMNNVNEPEEDKNAGGKETMKSAKVLILLLSLLLSSSFVSNLYAEEKGITGSASAGIFNRYIFRGYELSNDSIVVQPALSVSYKGFSAAFWGNIDTDEHPTQSFVPDRKGHKSFNETDLTLSYTYSVEKLSLTGGYIYYGTKYAQETEEIFLSASYDVITKPTLTVYRDITSYPGTYINLYLSHSAKIYKDITLDLGASASYFVGDDGYWKTYDSSTGTYTGEKYSAFHDGMVKAGFTIPLVKNFSVQPVAQYWFPLSSKAKRLIDGNSYNPNGQIDDTFVWGVNMTVTF
jgi:hypothetical protein